MPAASASSITARPPPRQHQAERSALALAEKGTRLADAHDGVSDETWAQVRKHYDDDQKTHS